MTTQQPGQDTTIRFDFDAAVLGMLSTHAGIVATHSDGFTRFEAFDASGDLLDALGPWSINLRNGTADDRFFGAVHDQGLSAIAITMSATNLPHDFAVDHLQYGGVLEPVTVLALQCWERR